MMDVSCGGPEWHFPWSKPGTIRELHGGHPGCLRMKSLTRMFC